MPNSDIYKMLFEYIQDDNKFKTDLLNKINSIETQTKLTNGQVLRNTAEIAGIKDRMTLIQGDIVVLQQKEDTKVIVSRINWKWLAAIGAVVMVVINLAIDLVGKLLAKFFINN